MNLLKGVRRLDYLLTAGLVALAGVLAVAIVTLIEDASTGGLSALLLSVPSAAIFYGIGLFTQSRAGRQGVQVQVLLPAFERV